MLTILGAGKIATALASVLSQRSRRVVLYSIEPSVTEEINTKHTNKGYLPEAILPAHVSATNDIEEAVQDASFIFIAVPSNAVASVLSAASPYLNPQAIIVSITKGIDSETLEPLILHQTSLLPLALRSRIVLLGGPATASELVRSSVTGLVASSPTIEHAETVRKTFEHACIRIKTTTDVIGVGLSSALKNVYCIALGMCDGLKFSANVKALVFTCAITEMRALIIAAGGKDETVLHLAGIGDLYVSSHSRHSQNRSFGQRLARGGVRPHTTLPPLEGIVALQSALKLARQHQIQTPLLHAIERCIYGRVPSAKPLQSYLTHLKWS
jgi:glycerol-3-phosphate dehydrogenase (NAD(P)+)